MRTIITEVVPCEVVKTVDIREIPMEDAQWLYHKLNVDGDWKGTPSMRIWESLHNAGVRAPIKLK